MTLKYIHKQITDKGFDIVFDVLLSLIRTDECRRKGPGSCQRGRMNRELFMDNLLT